MHLFFLGDSVANLKLSEEWLMKMVDNLDDNAKKSIKHS